MVDNTTRDLVLVLVPLQIYILMIVYLVRSCRCWRCNHMSLLQPTTQSKSEGGHTQFCLSEKRNIQRSLLHCLDVPRMMLAGSSMIASRTTSVPVSSAPHNKERTHRFHLSCLGLIQNKTAHTSDSARCNKTLLGEEREREREVDIHQKRLTKSKSPQKESKSWVFGRKKDAASTVK